MCSLVSLSTIPHSYCTFSITITSLTLSLSQGAVCYLQWNHYIVSLPGSHSAPQNKMNISSVTQTRHAAEKYRGDQHRAAHIRHTCLPAWHGSFIPHEHTLFGEGAY